MPPPPPDADPSPKAAHAGPRKQAGAMGRRVGSGLTWLMIATVVIKFASMANIAVLGIFLEDTDFGIFGTAIGVAALINVLRDGGVRRILIQKGAHRYNGLVGPVYAWTVLFNLLAAAVLCGLGPVLASYHDNRQYVLVMVTLGIAAGMYGPSMIYRAKLSMDLRFKAVAGMNTSSSLVQYAAMVVLAIAGAGPLAFTLPLVITAIFEWVYGLCLTRDPLLRFQPKTRLWPAIWARSKWLLMGAMALALLRQGDYLVLGFLLDERVMGVYVFAYMIANQVAALLARNLEQVLMPTMAAFQHDTRRHVASVLRVSGALTLMGAILAGGIAVTFDPMQDIIWQGKWADAVPAVQALSLGFALRLVVGVQEIALSSTGRFRTQFLASLAQGIGMAAAAAVGGLLFPKNVGMIAAIIGLYFVVGVTGVTARSLRSAGVPTVGFLNAVLPPWGMITILALILILAETTLGNALGGWQSPTIPLHGFWLQSLRFVTLGVVYTLVAILAVRLFMAGTLRDLLNIAPAKLARPARLVLALPHTE